MRYGMCGRDDEDVVSVIVGFYIWRYEGHNWVRYCASVIAGYSIEITEVVDV
jgi:hypothetical protein